MIPLLLHLHGVVDRVEGDVAVVEWRADAFADLPLALMPAETTEGCHLTVTVGPAPDGPLLALDAHHLRAAGGPHGAVTIALPPETSLRAGGHYALRVELNPAEAPSPLP